MSEGGRDKKVAKERWPASLGKIREGGGGVAYMRRTKVEMKPGK
jgi:hypothetical protein